MKKTKPLLYGFNQKFEYRTYKNVGRSLKLNFKAKYSKAKLLYKVIIKIRNFINKNEKKYKNFDTYFEWEKYIEDIGKSKCFYSNDYYLEYIRFLKRKKKRYGFEQSIYTSIIMPLYVAIATGGLTLMLKFVNDEDIIYYYNFITSVWISFGTIILYSVISLNSQINKRYNYSLFYGDYIKILEKVKNNKNKEPAPKI